MSELSLLDNEREIERLKRVPSTIILDYIRTYVSKLINQLDDFKQGVKKEVFEEEDDDFTRRTLKRNEMLTLEKDRLALEVVTLTKEISEIQVKNTELQLKIEDLKKDIEELKKKRKEDHKG